MIFKNYSTRKYHFRDLVKEFLDVESLSKIHNGPSFRYNEKFQRENDQSTHYHKAFYDLSRTDAFQNLYKVF